MSRLQRILTAVSDKAMAYFLSLPKTDITDEALQQRAKALVKIGTVRSSQGDLAAATRGFSPLPICPITLRRRHATSPGNWHMPTCWAYIGTMRWYQGDLDGAQRAFDAAQQVLLRAQAIAPDDPQLLFQLSTVDNSIGHVLEGRGRIDQAQMHYHRMLEAAQRLARLGPSNVAWQNRSALRTAIWPRWPAAQRRALDRRIPRRCGDRSGTGSARSAQQRTARTPVDLARHARQGLLLAGALERRGADPRGARRCTTPRRNGTRKHRIQGLGLYSTQLARMQRLRSGLSGAVVLTDASLAMLRSAVARDAAQPGWQRELAEALIEQAEQAIASGRRNAADSLHQGVGHPRAAGRAGRSGSRHRARDGNRAAAHGFAVDSRPARRIRGQDTGHARPA